MKPLKPEAQVLPPPVFPPVIPHLPPNAIWRELGEELRRCRFLSGNDIEDVARFLSVWPHTLNEFEQGRWRPTDHQLNLFAAVYESQDVDLPHLTMLRSEGDRLVRKV